MYFFYIDESGTPESSDRTSRFFVVCATVFHNSRWSELYGKMEGLKRQFFPGPEAPGQERFGFHVHPLGRDR